MEQHPETAKHRHAGFYKETFPDLSDEEERELLEYADELYEEQHGQHHAQEQQ